MAGQGAGVSAQPTPGAEPRGWEVSSCGGHDTHFLRLLPDPQDPQGQDGMRWHAATALCPLHWERQGTDTWGNRFPRGGLRRGDRSRWGGAQTPTGRRSGLEDVCLGAGCGFYSKKAAADPKPATALQHSAPSKGVSAGRRTRRGQAPTYSTLPGALLLPNSAARGPPGPSLLQSRRPRTKRHQSPRGAAARRSPGPVCSPRAALPGSQSCTKDAPPFQSWGGGQSSNSRPPGRTPCPQPCPCGGGALAVGPWDPTAAEGFLVGTSGAARAVALRVFPPGAEGCRPETLTSQYSFPP